MDKITLEQVKDLVTTIVEENPDAINPRVVPGDHRTACRYQRLSDDNTPNTAQRCLGGEVLYRLGLRFPAEGQGVKSTLDADRFESGALEYLSGLQFNADWTNGPTFDPIPRTWAEAKRRVDIDRGYRVL